MKLDMKQLKAELHSVTGKLREEYFPKRQPANTKDTQHLRRDLFDKKKKVLDTEFNLRRQMIRHKNETEVTLVHYKNLQTLQEEHIRELDKIVGLILTIHKLYISFMRQSFIET